MGVAFTLILVDGIRKLIYFEVYGEREIAWKRRRAQKYLLAWTSYHWRDRKSVV